MKHEPDILKPVEESPSRVTHLIIIVMGRFLGGFIVAIFVSMLVTSFFPDLSPLGA